MEEDDGQGAERGVSRRTLIGGAAAGAAAGALPRTGVAEARTAKRRTRRADVVVVGAGLSGLAAAEAVVRAGKSVLVVEARRRVGGRTRNDPIGGRHIVEGGGQWAGPTQDAILGWARDLGVATFPTYNVGDYIYYRNGNRFRYQANTPLGAIPPDEGAAEAGVALARLNDMASQVPLDAPWRAPQAAEWDAQTADTWVRDNTVSPGGRFLVDIGISALYAAEPRDVSLLHLLFYIRAAGNEQNPGNFERLINTAGGAQEQRFVGGSQQIAVRAARRLGRRRFLMGAPVRRIVQQRDGVEVQSDKVRVRAKRVIVTVPPTLAGRIDYRPAMPNLRDQLTQRIPMGSAIKAHAVYERPFWRDNGQAGQAVSDRGPARITFDNSPPDGRPGVLLGFVEGHFAREHSRRSPAERRAAVLRNFADIFGEQALRPIRYLESDWSAEPWTRGCFVGFTPPGVLLDYGDQLRPPVGRIHWAGSETATIWNGYMDGAVRSGRRAAAEVLSRL